MTTAVRAVRIVAGACAAALVAKDTRMAKAMTAFNPVRDMDITRFSLTAPAARERSRSS